MSRGGTPSSRSRPGLVSEARLYAVLTAADARRIAGLEIARWGVAEELAFGLPEIDDRYHVWRVPVLRRAVGEGCGEAVGEVVIDAHTGEVQARRSSRAQTVRARLGGAQSAPSSGGGGKGAAWPGGASGNLLLEGDSRRTLAALPDGSVQLVFTSPPYYNARPDYTDYLSYEDYLESVREVMRECARVLAEGRFFVMNVAPVLLRRSSRARASRRLAVPFDMHRLFTEEGFEFIDDIIWEKPEGAGWATGRGRRFAADRQPLQYKAVPVTEYLLVYRRATERLIDWNIRSHPDQGAVARSRIEGEYERTNVWRIAPAHSREHPAVFPLELAERVVRYYSFEGDVVLDPFAGIGTTGRAAAGLGRRFVLGECEPDYVEVIRRDLGELLAEGSPGAGGGRSGATASLPSLDASRAQRGGLPL